MLVDTPRVGGAPAITADVATVRVPAPAAPPVLEQDAAAGEMPDVPARAQAGDPAAWAELFERYQDVLMRFVYSRVRGDRHLAEDLVQDVWARALKRLSGSFVWCGKDVGAWLVTIARNLIADHYKSHRVRRESPSGLVLHTEEFGHHFVSSLAGAAELAAQRDLYHCAERREGTPSAEETAIGHLTNAVANTALLAAMQLLTWEQRHCIALRFFRGCSVAETAALMNRNEGAIKALQYRAVQRLGRLLPEGFREVTG